MKIEIDCEIPAGYEATGEYRRVEDNKTPHLSEAGNLCFTKSLNNRIILRKISPKMRPMTMGERIYILSTPHCVVRCPNIQLDNWHPNYDLRPLNVNDWEYGFVREDGSIDGPYKFEKEA